MPLLYGVLPLLILLPGSPAGGQPEGEPPGEDQAVGWYEFAPDRFRLVTWGPSGGLRLHDFDEPRFETLVAREGGGYLWKRGGPNEDRVVTFDRDEDDGTIELHWRGPGVTQGRARQVTTTGYRQEEVHYKNGDVPLVGLLMTPRTKGPHPAVVFIHGSGDSDRDNVWAFTFANHLARHGVAVLFPDKRGCGESGGDWRTADFWDLSGDALAAVRLLRARQDIDAARVGVFGLSQGGWVAPLAAARSRHVGFVVNVVGAAVTVGEQLEHELEQDLRRAGLPGDATKEVLGLQRLLGRHLRGEIPWQEYESALKRGLAGPHAAAVEPFPSSPDDWRLAFYHRIAGFDPLPYWRRLEVPAVTVYGELDESDNVPVKESVSRLKGAFRQKEPPRWSVRVFEGSGHALVDPRTKWVRRDVLDYLTQWILDNSAAKNE